MIGRSMFRALRWVGLAAVAPALWACQARSLEAPVLKPEATFTKSFAQSINRNVDMLFLIDDSSSMRLSQANLERNFPAFMTTLRGPARGRACPTSTSRSSRRTWARAMVRSASCDSSGGKNGIFQYTARTPCAATNLQQGATYIIDSGGQRNYTGNLEDVFTCIAALGQEGCGFEHQFAAIKRALGADGRAAPRRTRASSAPRPTWRSPDHQRGRLLRDARRAVVRHRYPTRTSCRSSVRLRTSAATSSVTCVTASTRAATRRTMTAPRPSPTTPASRTKPEGYLLGSRTPRTGSRGSNRSRPGHRRGNHRPGDALYREMESAEHGGHLVRRGVLPVADIGQSCGATATLVALRIPPCASTSS